MKRKRFRLFGGLSLPNRMFDTGPVDPDIFGSAPASVPTTPSPDPVDSNPSGGDDRSDLFNAPNASTPDASGNSAALAAPRAPADPNYAGAARPQVAAQPDAAQWQSIREAAAAQGYQFDATVTDDRGALNHLLRQAQANRQADVYAQLGRQLAPNAGRIGEFLRQPTTPATPTRQPWEAPEFDERWAGLVDRDPSTGLYVGKQGVPSEIVSKVNAYAEWKTAYDRDPAKMINGMVEAKAKQIASTEFREQFAAQAREQSIESIVQQNAPWLYARDAAGQPVRNYEGQRVPSPIGASYIKHLSDVQRMGVTDPRQQDALAKRLAKADYEQNYYATRSAAAAVNPAAVARPNVNPLQAQTPIERRNNPAATEPTGTGLSMSEMLRQGFASEGVTDSDFAHNAD